MNAKTYPAPQPEAKGEGTVAKKGFRGSARKGRQKTEKKRRGGGRRIV